MPNVRPFPTPAGTSSANNIDCRLTDTDAGLFARSDVDRLPSRDEDVASFCAFESLRTSTCNFRILLAKLIFSLFGAVNWTFNDTDTKDLFCLNGNIRTQ